jgi:hypothetical protein
VTDEFPASHGVRNRRRHRSWLGLSICMLCSYSGKLPPRMVTRLAGASSNASQAAGVLLAGRPGLAYNWAWAYTAMAEPNSGEK